MKKFAILGCAALILSACGETPAEQEAAAGPVDTMLPGEYRITTEITRLDSTDNTTPAVKAALGDKTTATVCIGGDGLLPAETFGEPGDNCTIENPYVRRGRIRQNLRCAREGASGEIMLDVDATFTEDGVEGQINGESFFAGSGDYAMSRSINGNRVGDCTQAEAEEELEEERVEGEG